MNVTADWIMVQGKDGDTYYGVKENKKNENLMSKSELQEMTNDVIELGNRNHEAYQYLFTDLLEIKQGVFKWNESSKSFNKVSYNLDDLEKIPMKVDVNELFEKGKKEIEYQQNAHIRSILPDKNK